MSRRSRRAFDPLTIGLAVAAVLVLAAIAALQLSGGMPRGDATALTAADVQRMSPQEARDLLAEGEAILLDVRSAAEYTQAHAEGAYHYPVNEAAQLVDTLPDEGTLIFY